MNNVDLENKEINLGPVKESFTNREQNTQLENDTVDIKSNNDQDLKFDNNQELNGSKNRCYICNKKLGLIPFKCRCKGMFCPLHKPSVKHNCDFDYKKYGKEKLKKDNPMIKTSKIDKI